AAAGFVHVVAAGGGDIGHRTGQRDGDPQGLLGGLGRAAAEADEDAGRAGAHQVQGRGGGGAAAAAHPDGQRGDEGPGGQRFAVRGDVLGGDGGAADEEQVHAGVHHGPPVLLGALRGQRAGGGDPGVAQLLEPVADQLGPDRLLVDGAHHVHDVLVRGLGDARELGGGVLVAGPQPFEVEHAEPAEPAERDRRLGRHQRVHRGGEDRDVEVVGVHLPGGGDVLRV